ncbi:unnamed protein product [Clavelina lepadiformis]|uniref:SUN domain-containing protein n=1 Tax=Clavelina lepadiformis TaxID=159417 RepID=A0ABP0GIW0_CLALP
MGIFGDRGKIFLLLICLTSQSRTHEESGSKELDDVASTSTVSKETVISVDEDEINPEVEDKLEYEGAEERIVKIIQQSQEEEIVKTSENSDDPDISSGIIQDQNSKKNVERKHGTEENFLEIKEKEPVVIPGSDQSVLIEVSEENASGAKEEKLSDSTSAGIMVESTHEDEDVADETLNFASEVVAEVEETKTSESIQIDVKDPEESLKKAEDSVKELALEDESETPNVVQTENKAKPEDKLNEKEPEPGLPNKSKHQSNENETTKDDVTPSGGQTNADSDAQTTKPAEEKPAVKLEVDDIQSFEEWKKKQIQNKEVAGTENGSPSQRVIRTKKSQVNYASQDCGAKVLSNNPEAKHVSAILDENKDMYMLNPCSTNIWFVIELCEPIQVRQIQLANLELFSSSPRVYDLSISERFPAREWKPLGTFEARNERTVQTFAPNREELMFTKYLKFEMKSHFGNEHFCPLTLLRVFGVSMVEEYEQVNEDKDLKETNDRSVLSELNEVNAKNIEGKDTAGNKQEDSSIKKMYKLMKNAVDNLLGNGEVENSNKTLSTKDSALKNDTARDEIDPTWESPVTLITNNSEVEKLAHSSKKQPIVTLIETGDGQEVVFGESTPLYPMTFLTDFSPKQFSTKLCWLLEFVYRVSILSCIVQPHGNHTSSIDGIAPEYLGNDTSEVEKPLQPPDTGSLLEESEEERVVMETPTETKDDSIQDQSEDVVEDKIESSTVSAEDDKASVKIIPDAENPPQEEEGRFVDGEIPPPDHAHINDDISEVFKGESKNPEQCKSANDDLAPPGGHAVKTSDAESDKSSVESSDVEKEAADGTRLEEVDQSSSGKKDDNFQHDGEILVDKEKVEENKQVNDESDSSNDIVDVGEAPSAIPPLKKDEEKMENDHVENEVVINPGTNQKESVLMRLSNRIRSLEQNMSLSSTYLEDLSKRYKRQMDEMQRAFNLTQVRLREASSVSDENNLKQTEAIAALKVKIEILKIELADVTGSLDQVNRYMIARHLCLMAIEGIVLVVLCVSCFGVRQIRMVRRLEESERQIHQLLLHQKSQASNGFVKAKVPKQKNHLDAIEDLRITRTYVEPNIHPEPDRPSINGRRISSTSGSTSPSMLNKKSLKSSLSPLHKRKMKHGGKVRKSMKLNAGRLPQATSDTGIWTSELGNKKQADMKTNKNPTKHEKKGESFRVKSSCSNSRFFTTSSTTVPGCRSNLFPWNNPNNMFGTLSGKAR